jgi:non-specific serine/threonine protein kinase
MAWNLYRRGQVNESERLAQEALQMQRNLNFGWAATDSWLLLALIARAKGQHERATACYHESFLLSIQSRDLLLIATSFDHAAGLFASGGDDERVAILFGASDRLHEIAANVPDDEQRASRELHISRARRRLGDDVFDHLYQHGQAMSPEEVLAIALEASVPPSTRLVPQAAARWGITRRELDVLALMATGMTDQEIADTLFIGRRTVNTHVSHLLAKLDAGSRKDAARIAVEAGLVTSRER